MTRRGRDASSTSTSEKGTQTADRPTPDPTPTGGPNLFQTPEQGPEQGPGLVGNLRPENANPSTDPASSWGDAGGGPSVGGGTPSGVSGSDRRSTPKKPGGLRKSELKKLTSTAVRTVGGVLNVVLTAANSAEREYGLWIPDTEDVAEMADPLAGIASRRMPEGTDNPDAVDIGRLISAVGGYIGKQLRRRAELRSLAAPQDFYAGPDDGGDQGDPDRFGPTVPEDTAAAGRPASGPLAFLRGRHDGNGMTATTDPQPDLDLSGGTDNERTGA